MYCNLFISIILFKLSYIDSSKDYFLSKVFSLEVKRFH